MKKQENIQERFEKSGRISKGFKRKRARKDFFSKGIINKKI